MCCKLFRVHSPYRSRGFLTISIHRSVSSCCCCDKTAQFLLQGCSRDKLVLARSLDDLSYCCSCCQQNGSSFLHKMYRGSAYIGQRRLNSFSGLILGLVFILSDDTTCPRKASSSPAPTLSRLQFQTNSSYIIKHQPAEV